MDSDRLWLTRLAPAEQVELTDSSCSAETVNHAVSMMGAGPVCWAIEHGRTAAVRIVREVPRFGGGSAAIEVLRRGSEASTLQSLLRLAQPTAELPPVSDESLVGVRDFVRRSIPLDRMLRGIRIGHADLARAFLCACEELVEPDRLAREMTAVNDELFRYVDAFSDSMTREYLAEYDQWITSAAATRVATVHAVLGCTAPDVRAASRTLGYDLERIHLGTVVWADSPAQDPRLQSSAVELLHARGATTTLVVPVGAARVWAWGTVTGDRPPTVLAPADGLHAALGTPARGPTGFRRTHREALAVERLRGLAPERGDRVTDYHEVAPAVLLSSDLPAAGDFVRSELGELAVQDETTATLRTTLLHYLTAERSLIRVAEELHIARGTVAYRVKRAQQLLGRDLADRRLPLHAALLLADELDEAVLAPPPSEY